MEENIMTKYAEAIKEMIAHRKENNETNIVHFYISPANANTNIYKDELIKKIIKKFIAAGIYINPMKVDTVRGSFNSNRDFIETGEVEAAIEYSGVYPVNMDPEDSAWLSKLDDEGKIRIMVFVKQGDELVPNY